MWKLWFLNLNGYDFSFFYPGLILTTGIVTFYLRVRFVQAALLNIITILSYILLYAFFIREVPSGSQISLNQIFVNSLFFIICSSFLSLYGAYYLEKFTRNDFLIRSEIEHLNNNLEALVDQRTAELEEEKQKNIRLLLEGQEKERERIAKELHDGVCNQLALLKLDLEHQIQKQDFSRISESLESILKINQEVRDISHNQSTYTLQKHGLQKAVENSVHQLINKHDIRFNVHFHNIGNSICETTQLMLYRVFQESVNNILKHSGATEVDIQLMQHENELNLTIYDNGRGFNKNLVNGSGLGLHNMQLRIEQQCNGKLIVDSQPDYGTTIIVNIDNS
ncbi:MAG: sensor histidine kinase [Bacteroidales bacterium]